MSDVYENVTLDEEYQPLLLSMGQYKLFMAHGAAGRDAMAVFLHLMFTARLQHTNQVKANLKYLAAGVSLGERSVKRAKALLAKWGIIEYYQPRREDGTVGEQYIRLRYMPTREATERAEAAIDGAETGGSLTAPPVDRTTGSDRQMLEVNKGNASNEQGTGEAPPIDTSYVVSESELQDWTEDYSDIPLQSTEADRANLSKLPYPRAVIRDALTTWLTKETRGDRAPLLRWFLSQGGPYLREASEEAERVAAMQRSAARAHEEAKRAREEVLNTSPEQEAEALEMFAKLKEKLAEPVAS